MNVSVDNSQVDNNPTDESFVKNVLPAGYGELLVAIKARVQTAQLRAALAVNTELVLLYWSIGRDILARQEQEGWGAKVIERLASDLRRAFPDMKGFSRTNLLYMRAFAESCPDEPFVQQVAGQIPWFHNCTLLDKVRHEKNGTGTCAPRRSTAGAEPCWCIRSRRSSMRDRGRPSPTSSGRCLRLNPTWRARR